MGTLRCRRGFGLPLWARMDAGASKVSGRGPAGVGGLQDGAGQAPSNKPWSLSGYSLLCPPTRWHALGGGRQGPEVKWLGPGSPPSAEGRAPH